MKVENNQLELIEIQDDVAFFNVKELNYTFDVAFDYETELVQAELDFFMGTGLLACVEVSFIDINYVSYLYDEDKPLGSFDVSKSELETIIKSKLEYDLN
tara:strand:- start:245 stop:544 length:300 start_codon:yes stop_codon:yes gene_type:complete